MINAARNPRSRKTVVRDGTPAASVVPGGRKMCSTPSRLRRSASGQTNATSSNQKAGIVPATRSA